MVNTNSSARCGWPLIGALLALLALAPPPADARELFWPRLDVEAQLDADGRLHVVERQTINLTGDWNGAERRFNLRRSQRLELDTLVRIDPETGARTPLRRGKIDRVGRYKWFDNHTLRWRARLASDPDFDATTLIYELRYSIAPVLVENDGRFDFRHDFAFADRIGTIEQFTLNMVVDPVWQSEEPLPTHEERGPLFPSESVIFSTTFDHGGTERPSAVLYSTPLPFRIAAFLASIMAIFAVYQRFRRHEAARGRFASPAIPNPPSRAWLDNHLFDLLPEEVGALWDRKVSAPEVAAVLARMVSEGKLASTVTGTGRKRVLHLKRLRERAEFTGYERTLVDKLFFNDRIDTDTQAIAKHYKKTGFDPASIVRGPITRGLRRKATVGDYEPPPHNHRPWWLLLAFVASLALEALTRGIGALQVLGVVFAISLLPVLFGTVMVGIYKVKTRHLLLTSLGFLGPALGLATLSLALLTVFPDTELRPGWFGVVAMALFPLCCMSLWCLWARTRESAQAMARRQELGAIRRYLAAELEKDEPALDDEWLPYLMAFGLDKQVDRWFRDHAGSRRTAGTTMETGASSGGFSGASRDGSPTWTGGGGSFGGAGATAAWATAATGLAAGVARPSSGSGSGGFSSGGGSFSGGGGGGGW